MRPVPLRTRTDLLRILRPYAISVACGRAMDEDRTQVLGTFNGAGSLPHFVVKITSEHGREWLMSLTLDEPAYEYRIGRTQESIMWSHWSGDSERRDPLLDGDEPEVYARKRDNDEIYWTPAYRAARDSQKVPR